ncbi:putative type II secretion system protein E [Hyalella azteca]|uniref:Type II secretion system protein E n=1 Tax=Hyalella azteca TaxID=294128 RepID=A0A8B7PFE1_HYAAZ|nr:putative type II secretion system protein E [Hyalella azteca]
MFVFSLPGPRIIKLRVMMVPVVLPDREEMMPKLVLRLLGNRIEQMALTDLGIPDYERNDQITAIQLLCERKNGLILVSGPTGSGKTTTLSAVQREMLKTYPNRVYYTIEDPVEISIPNVNHVQVNQEAELTFSRGLKAFLRGDPDVIMVGEIRDMDAATQALTASITGHLVLSTIHTNSAIETAIRLIDMGCDSFIVSSALKAATAQRLVKRLCTECSMEASWDELTSGLHPVLNHRDNKLMRLRYTNAPRTYSDLDFYPDGRTVRIKGPGCSKCDGGIKGRALVSELFLMTPNVSQAIASKQSFATVHQIAVESGFKDLWQHAMFLIRTGVISFDDAVGDIGERDVLSPSEKKGMGSNQTPQDRPSLSVVGQSRI